MRLTTLGTRGTDVITAALRLPARFARDELIESYGGLRRQRGDILPAHWKQGISNEVQRLSSDCSRFHKEHRKLDLISVYGAGRYAIRDAARPLLIAAANEAADLLHSTNSLLVPNRAADSLPAAATNHLVGTYAQERIMEVMRMRGCEITDCSQGSAYDFHFIDRTSRTAPPGIMECKGTRAGELDVALTANEMEVAFRCALIYWLGVVYDIRIAEGRAVGGSVPFITPPPVLDTWRFLQSTSRLRRRDLMPMLPGLLS